MQFAAQEAFFQVGITQLNLARAQAGLPPAATPGLVQTLVDLIGHYLPHLDAQGVDKILQKRAMACHALSRQELPPEVVKDVGTPDDEEAIK
eukprot:4190476-Lingulodinium_polyedra.AAC.1